jgi:alpha-glucosidase
MLGVSCAVLLSVCGLVQSATAHAENARISPLHDGVQLTAGSSVLDVQVLENRVVRVHVRPNGQSTPRTLVMDPHPPLMKPTSIHKSEHNGVYMLSTPGISVRIKESAPYTITFFNASGRQLLRSLDPLGQARNGGVTMRHAPGEKLYGIHGLPLKNRGGGLTRDNGGKVVAGIQGNSGAPFIFSVRYGLLVDSNGGDFTTTADSFTFEHDSRTDVEYYVLAGPPLQTMAALSRLAGPPPLPPEWTLGFLNSQWGATESQVEKIVATYRKKQIPIDGFILDFDWKAWGEDNYGEWRWNSTSGPGNVAPDKFPDGASGVFAKKLAAEGVKLAGILKPRILMTVAGHPDKLTKAAAYATKHHLWYPNEAPVRDYYSHRMARDLNFNLAATRTWYWKHLLPAFHSGMVGWWDDEADIDGKTVFGNFQFFNMGRAIYDGQRADSNLRVWTLNRNFYLGAGRYGYNLWSGDIHTGFANMAYQRRRMLAALDTGVAGWSMDTGGFYGHPSPQNYARWVEFAAFVPIMRVHGFYEQKRQPWVYGPVAEAAARGAIDLRYKLLPYIYSYERLGNEGNVGLVRPLFWEFPSDPRSATVTSEWMFGNALLVAPIVTRDATSKAVYLPPGEWFDYATGRRYNGAHNIVIPADAKTWKDIPLFVRSGSILATQPLEQYVGQRPIQKFTLNIFPSHSKATFTAYSDDGETYNYEKGDYLQQKITTQRIGSRTEVTIGGAKGSYASPLRTYLLRIHTAAHSVTINGKPLAKVNPSALSANSASRWATANDRFGPVVLVRVVAGQTTPSVIVLQ